MLTLIELIHVKKKHEKLTLACKGDTLPALLVWFHHNLAGFSNSNNDFCCFLSVITRYYDGPYTVVLLETGIICKFFTMIAGWKWAALVCWWWFTIHSYDAPGYQRR
jgi:hypothetical protein